MVCNLSLYYGSGTHTSFRLFYRFLTAACAFHLEILVFCFDLVVRCFEVGISYGLFSCVFLLNGYHCPRLLC